MTPLTAVMGNLETLTMTEVRLDEARRKACASVAMREAKRLERLVGDLLDAARLEAGGGDLQFGTVATKELFELVASHHEHECLARGVTLTQTIAPGAGRLFGDAFRLEQALVNVTANAMRYTPDGGRALMSAQPSDRGTVAIDITDFGPGIPPEDLPLIFDRFYKVRPTPGAASHGAGSGLGLSIVKAIVARHGGTVSATSTVGQGTTVRIELPAGQSSTAAVA
jgi:two-component system sensor histidine kinase BaeS